MCYISSLILANYYHLQYLYPISCNDACTYAKRCSQPLCIFSHIPTYPAVECDLASGLQTSRQIINIHYYYYAHYNELEQALVAFCSYTNLYKSS